MSSYNRYRKAFRVPDGNRVWLSPNTPIISTDPRFDDRLYTVREGDRLDVLSQAYLHDAQLWWVIAEYNNLFWMFDITVGQQLRIPSYEHVYMDLLT